MTSRLLSRLDAEIDAEKDLLRKDCLRANRAGVLARHGHIGQARRIVNELRTRSRRSEHPELAAWLSLTEGMIEHYDTLTPAARQRFLRAHALSRAAQLRPMQALSAAWLAVSESNARAWSSMVDHLAEAYGLSEPTDHATRARVGNLMGHTYLRCGQTNLATPWYQVCRQHATADGDTSMLSGMLYSRTAMATNYTSLMAAFGRADAAAVRQALLETESTANFDAGLGVASLKDVLPVLRGQALVAAGQYAQGLALLMAHGEGAVRQGFSSYRSRFRAAIGYCHAQLGDLAAARLAIEDALADLTEEMDDDDRACTFAYAAQVLRLSGDTVAADEAQARAEQELLCHQDEQREVATLMAERGPRLDA